MPRLFTGIELPEHWRAALAALRQPLPGARWIEPDELHMTLRFAGDIDNRTAAEFADLLAAVGGPSFELRLHGVGAFGGNSPHSLWAGARAGPELDTLVRANERAARAAGLAPEQRNFKPHVTLARLKNVRPEVVARYLQRNAAFATDAVTVSQFVLFSARPLVGGGPYVAEEVYPLLEGGRQGGASGHRARD